MSVEERLDALEQVLASTANLSRTAATDWWLLFNGTLVFFMQCGFAMLEAGAVSAKSTQNIMLKNIMDPAIGVRFFFSSLALVLTVAATPRRRRRLPSPHRPSAPLHPSTPQILAFWSVGYGICYGHKSNVDDQLTFVGNEWVSRPGEGRGRGQGGAKIH